jgi:AefR-like transcriptional repressor, C-terminal domain
VAEGRRLLAAYLAARVAAGELRERDTGAAAQLLLSTLAFGQVTGSDADPAAMVDVLLHGVAAASGDAPVPGG